MEIGIGIGSNSGSANYKYKYNGKELQDELNLNVYAYGWRDYDPAIGRFNKIDRFAEKYASLSTYSYTANNPIIYVDVQGDSIRVSNAILFKQDMNTIYGKDTNYFNVDNNGNVNLSANGIVAIIKGGVNGLHDYKNESLSGVTQLISSEVVTNIIYSNDELKDSSGNLITGTLGDVSKTGIRPSDTGGEVTTTVGDNPTNKENNIYINPAGTHTLKISSLKDNITIADLASGNTHNTKTYNVPRANNVMHGIGHVLYQGAQEQNKVIRFDNANRRLNNQPINTDPSQTHQ